MGLIRILNGSAFCTACTEVASITLSSNNVGFGASVTLGWTGAKAGIANAISGYEVYRDGVLLTTVTGTSCTVVSKDSNGSYEYTVKTLGTIAGFNSSVSTASATLTSVVSVPTAPTALSIAKNNVGFGASVALSWSGANAGTNNAITGYEIWRSTSASGTYTKLTTVSTSATSGSVNVTSPTTNSSYYYKIKTIGTVTGFTPSVLSGNYATLTSVVTAPTAPTAVSLSATDVRIGKSVTLSWGGAKGGTNNPIAKYQINRNGAYLTETTGTSCAVSAAGTAGTKYTYTVYAIGSVSGWNSGASGGVTLTAHTAEYSDSYFTSSTTWTIPAWAEQLIVTCIGGGGGAGSSGYDYGGSNEDPGGGGGGGSGEKKDATFGSGRFTPGATVAITVGAAGTGATYSPSGGGSGGASSFGSLLSARGGGAGQPGGSTNVNYPNGGRGGDGGICGGGGGFGRRGPNSGNIGSQGANGANWSMPDSDAAYYVFNDTSTSRRLGRGGKGGGGTNGGNGPYGNDSLPGTRYGQGGDGNMGNGSAGIVAVRVGRYLS